MVKKFAELRAMNPVPPMVSTLGPLSKPGRDCAPIEEEEQEEEEDEDVEDLEDVVVKEEGEEEEEATAATQDQPLFAALPPSSRSVLRSSSHCPAPPSSILTRSSRSSVARAVARRSDLQPMDNTKSGGGCQTCTCKCTDLLTRVENLEKEVLALRRESGVGLDPTPKSSTRRSQVLQLTPKLALKGGMKGTLYSKWLF